MQLLTLRPPKLLQAPGSGIYATTHTAWTLGIRAALPEIAQTARESANSVVALTGGASVGGPPRGAAVLPVDTQRLGLSDQVVLVNGNVGLLERRPDGRLFAVIGFTIARGKIVEMDILADPERLSRLDLSAIESRAGPPYPRFSCVT